MQFDPAFQSPSAVETYITLALSAGTWILYAVALLTTLIFTAVLASKSKAPGRRLLLIGAILFVGGMTHYLLRDILYSHRLFGILPIVVMAFLPAFGSALMAIGFSRLVRSLTPGRG